MKRPKGPELKLSELKVPPFLTDLYWDLRDRRLLPLVALVAVAIVAVPFLLGGKSDESSTRGVVAVATPDAAAGGPDSSTLVAVEAKPGLRDYHKRLAHRRPTNPFKPRYSGPQLAGSELGGGELSSTSTTSTSTTTTKTSSGTTTTETTTESPGGAGGGGESPPSLKEYTIAIDVKITRTETKANGKKEKSEPTVHHRVIPPAALPSEKTQAVAYMGLSPKTKQPLLLISDGVTAIFGEGNCISGAQACQLLEVEPGLPETFVFGPNSARYKIVVLNPRPVVVGTYER
ncbi:MAG: hypothetical protein ACJ75S_04235 [Solirubrobacterales bacterium]